MNIVTICTPDHPWFNIHLPRWLRYARRSNPTAKLCLFLPSDDPRILTDKTVRGFDEIKLFPMSAVCRPWFNEVRMEATSILGVDEVLYIDCDCDIYGDLSDIPEKSDKDLLWCRSPVIHPPWMEFCDKLGFGIPEFAANNGLLYLRRSFKDEYQKAKELVDANKPPARISGTFAFNAMLRQNPDANDEIDYKYSTIWWDAEKLKEAKTIQYCSDDGQKKRIMLETYFTRAM